MDENSVSKEHKVYKELTFEVLAALSDDELEDAILNYIFTKFIFTQDTRPHVEIVASMPASFQMIWSTWMLWWSVAHGGFNEFFYGESDKLVIMTLQSLKMIGATHYYEILEQVIEAHKEEMRNPAMQELYSEKSVHGFSESYKMSTLKEYDDRFDRLGLQLHELKVRFIRSNLQLFVGS